jgi:large repetitive protein
MRRIRIVLLTSLVALIAVPAALAIRFTDDSYNMPTGYVGQPYSKQFNGAGGCGPALPYQYTLISGKLPPGLSLSFSGLISGTPTQAGSYSFYVNLSDQNPPSASWCRPAESQRQFTITVLGGGTPVAPLTISQRTLAPSATVENAPYSFQFTATGGGTQTWSLQSGLLPAGLKLSSNGLLSGTPTATGDFTFKVQVTDGSRTDAQTYTLSVVAPLTAGAPASVPKAEVSRPLQLLFAANGGKAPYKWAPAAGTTLPAGITLDGSTGVLSGWPEVAGSYALKLNVTDAVGLTSSVDVTLVVAPQLTTLNRTITSKIGRALHARLRATGGVQPESWRIVQGALPAGVHIGRYSGILSGRPRHAGTTELVIRVRDSLGAVSTARILLKIGS